MFYLVVFQISIQTKLGKSDFSKLQVSCRESRVKLYLMLQAKNVCVIHYYLEKDAQEHSKEF